MRKVISLTLLLLSFTMISMAQGLYSRENLAKASEEELSLLLTKAEGQKKAGAIITVTGTVALFTGAIMIFSNTEAAGYYGIYLSMAAIPVTIIGIPILASGSSKVKAISEAWNTRYNSAFIELAPCGIYDWHADNILPGLSLKVRF